MLTGVKFSRSEESLKIQKYHQNYFIINSKLCTLSKLVYTLILRCSLVSRAFPKAKYSLVCREFPVSSKVHFSQWKIRFSQFIFIDKYLNIKEIEYFIHYINFEMWPVLFYVNPLYFQQWNSNWDRIFCNSSLDSKLRFLNVGLRLTWILFLIHQKKIENLHLLMLL